MRYGQLGQRHRLPGEPDDVEVQRARARAPPAPPAARSIACRSRAARGGKPCSIPTMVQYVPAPRGRDRSRLLARRAAEAAAGQCGKASRRGRGARPTPELDPTRVGHVTIFAAFRDHLAYRAARAARRWACARERTSRGAHPRERRPAPPVGLGIRWPLEMGGRCRSAPGSRARGPVPRAPPPATARCDVDLGAGQFVLGHPTSV